MTAKAIRQRRSCRSISGAPMPTEKGPLKLGPFLPRSISQLRALIDYPARLAGVRLGAPGQEALHQARPEAQHLRGGRVGGISA